MDQILTTIMAYDYIYIVGFIFLVMVIQLISFYAAGKITGSINDEFMSALTLLGATFVLGMGSTLIKALLNIFLPGSLITTIAAFVLFLGLTIYIVIGIYDLSAGKALMYLIISFIIMAVVTGLLVYGGMKFLPGKEAIQGSATNALGAVTEEPATVEEPATTDDFVDPATAGLPGTETDTETGVATETEPAPEPDTIPEPDLAPEQFVPPVGSGPKLPETPVPPTEQ
jgi:hypothetical protein